MKHVIQLAGILLLLAAGCRSTDSIEQLQSGRRYDCDVVTILAPSNNAMTRTTLQIDDGVYNIYWKKDDKMGVFSNRSNNAKFTLTEEVGGNVAFKGFLSGEPTCAYYPYSSSAGNNPKSISMNLPDEQTQTDNNKPNMSYDLKSGQLDAGNTGSGYTFTFQQKLTLLRFTIKPDARLANDKLQSITLSAPSSRKLTGVYTIDITDENAVPSFGNNASNSVTVTFVPPINLSSDTEDTDVVGYAFINPDIAQDDQLVITVNTDKHVVTTRSATAGEDFVRGAIYEIGLNIAVLAAAKQIDVSPKDSWATTVSEPGYYTISGDVATVVHQYESGKDQYGWSTSDSDYSFRIQSMVKGRLSKMTISTPVIDVLGGTTTITLYRIHDDAGVVENTYKECTLLRKETEADKTTLWLQSQDGTEGFVIWIFN